MEYIQLRRSVHELEGQWILEGKNPFLLRNCTQLNSSRLVEAACADQALNGLHVPLDERTSNPLSFTTKQEIAEMYMNMEISNKGRTNDRTKGPQVIISIRVSAAAFNSGDVEALRCFDTGSNKTLNALRESTESSPGSQNANISLRHDEVFVLPGRNSFEFEVQYIGGVRVDPTTHQPIVQFDPHAITSNQQPITKQERSLVIYRWPFYMSGVVGEMKNELNRLTSSLCMPRLPNTNQNNGDFFLISGGSTTKTRKAVDCRPVLTAERAYFLLATMASNQTHLDSLKHVPIPPIVGRKNYNPWYAFEAKVTGTEIVLLGEGAKPDCKFDRVRLSAQSVQEYKALSSTLDKTFAALKKAHPGCNFFLYAGQIGSETADAAAELRSTTAHMHTDQYDLLCAARELGQLSSSLSVAGSSLPPVQIGIIIDIALPVGNSGVEESAKAMEQQLVSWTETRGAGTTSANKNDAGGGSATHVEGNQSRFYVNVFVVPIGYTRPPKIMPAPAVVQVFHGNLSEADKKWWEVNNETISLSMLGESQKK